MQTSAANKHVIVGLGKTGLSCARYFKRMHIPFSAMDTRESPPGIADFHAEFPQVKVVLGKLDTQELHSAAKLVMSPGVDLRTPEIKQAIKDGVRLTGDIDIFASTVSAPIVAITGSNAKSTVTTLVGEMALAAGLKVSVAGNIGTPVLDLLEQEESELYVLEVSSFQLETTSELGARVATVLNVSEDHMDRYDSFQAYREAKHRVFQNCQQVVVNRDDEQTYPQTKVTGEILSFGLRPSEEAGAFNIVLINGEEHIAFESETLIAAKELKIAGQHNLANAMAALALGKACGLPWEPMLQALRKFKGLEHRCQWVAEHNAVNWYNDSKGTNVGATIAAVTGLGKKGKIILLAGGESKGADFSPLVEAVETYARQVIVFGADAGVIANALKNVVPLEHAQTLQDAVLSAAQTAEAGDIVLLSPACASFDMFKNYEHRGEVFMRAVEELV